MISIDLMKSSEVRKAGGDQSNCQKKLYHNISFQSWIKHKWQPTKLLTSYMYAKKKFKNKVYQAKLKYCLTF